MQSLHTLRCILPIPFMVQLQIQRHFGHVFDLRDVDAQVGIVVARMLL
jgi:hypothetical protein